MLGKTNQLAPAVTLKGYTHAAIAAVNGVAQFCRHKPLGAAGGFIIVVMVTVALLAPVVAPYGARELIIDENGRTPVFESPGSTYLMGTDRVGRDVFSRVIYGARVSLYVGFGAVGIGVTGFFILGVVSAYAGGWFDLDRTAVGGRQERVARARNRPGHRGCSWFLSKQRHSGHSHRFGPHSGADGAVPSVVPQGNGLHIGCPGRGSIFLAHNLPPHRTQLHRHLPRHRHLLPRTRHHHRVFVELLRSGSAPRRTQLGWHAYDRRRAARNNSALVGYLSRSGHLHRRAGIQSAGRRPQRCDGSTSAARQVGR